jgi:hypothetical protein
LVEDVSVVSRSKPDRDLTPDTITFLGRIADRGLAARNSTKNSP